MTDDEERWKNAYHDLKRERNRLREEVVRLQVAVKALLDNVRDRHGMTPDTEFFCPDLNALDKALRGKDD